MNSRREVLTIAIGVVFVIGIAAFVFYVHARNSKIAAFDTAITQAEKLTVQGDCGAAVSAAQQAASTSPSTQDLATAQYRLAAALQCRNQPNDLQQSIDSLKTVAADQNAPAPVRASAYSRLASMYYNVDLNTNPQLMRKFVFDTPPFDSYLTQANNDVTKATLALFQRSIELGDSPYTEYQVAALQVVSMEQGIGLDPHSAEQKQISGQILGHIVTGDRFVAQAGTSTISTYYPLWWLFFPRAVALGVVSYYDPTVSSTTINTAYGEAISTLEAEKPSQIQQTRLLILKLDYAAVLSGHGWGTPGQIQALLSGFPVQPGTYPMLDAAISSVLRRPQNDMTLQQILTLEKSSQVFAAYMKTLEQQLAHK